MKKSSIIAIVIAVLAVIGAVALILAQPKTQDSASTGQNLKMITSKSDETPAEPNTIIISDYKFGPKSMTVKKGTKVTWINQDVARHNVETVENAPAGGPMGPLLAKGESYSFTFDTVGTFNYICSPHPYMKASVTVTE